MRFSLNRRKFLKTSALTVGAGAVGVVGDGWLGEPVRPRLTRLEIPLKRLPATLDGMTIAQLSDFHYDEEFTVIPIRKAIAIVNGLHPDLIVLTGDFVTIPPLAEYIPIAKLAAHTAEPCADILSQLRSKLGSYAVLGNHDSDSDGPRVIGALQSRGITVLTNRSVPIEHGGGRLWLAGIADALVGTPDLPATLGQVPNGEPVVLLAHEPDFADEAAKHAIDLQLSGHSHGGQVRLPIIGAPFLPDLARKYPWGLYQVGPTTLYTNSGLGTIRIPVRINAPPEVTLFTLRTVKA
ncbi:MAG TPA: metallophosphoesterase [Terriglobales bacterium]